jgi:hypothetical protein
MKADAEQEENASATQDFRIQTPQAGGGETISHCSLALDRRARPGHGPARRSIAASGGPRTGTAEVQSNKPSAVPQFHHMMPHKAASVKSNLITVCVRFVASMGP